MRADLPPTLSAAGPPASSLALVFDRLLDDILAGRYPAGARLPAERELARTLGASRPTLREALRRLSEWRLVEARRGSGVVVRDRREWSLNVLPAFLRHGAARLGPAALGTLLADLLALRRDVILDVVRVLGPRIPTPPAPGRALDEARAAVRRAWEARGDAASFVREDFAVLRAVVEAAGFLPALWLLNDLGDVYLGIARLLGAAPATVPEHYAASHERVLAALEAGDPAAAAGHLADYLDDHDRRLLAALGALP